MMARRTRVADDDIEPSQAPVIAKDKMIRALTPRRDASNVKSRLLGCPNAMRRKERTPGTDPKVMAARQREDVARLVAAKEDVEADVGVERPAGRSTRAPTRSTQREVEKRKTEVDGNGDTVHRRRNSGIATVRRGIRQDDEEVGSAPRGGGVKSKLTSTPAADLAGGHSASVNSTTERLVRVRTPCSARRGRAYRSGRTP